MIRGQKQTLHSLHRGKTCCGGGRVTWRGEEKRDVECAHTPCIGLLLDASLQLACMLDDMWCTRTLGTTFNQFLMVSACMHIHMYLDHS